MKLVHFITEHWDDVLAIIGGLTAVATVVVKLTPTQKDDAFLGKVIKVMSVFGWCNPDGSFVGKKELKK